LACFKRKKILILFFCKIELSYIVPFLIVCGLILTGQWLFCDNGMMKGCIRHGCCFSSRTHSWRFVLRCEQQILLGKMKRNWDMRIRCRLSRKFRDVQYWKMIALAAKVCELDSLKFRTPSEYLFCEHSFDMTLAESRHFLRAQRCCLNFRVSKKLWDKNPCLVYYFLFCDVQYTHGCWESYNIFSLTDYQTTW